MNDGSEMQDGFTIDALIDLLAEKVAAKVRAEIAQAGRMKAAVCNKRKSDYL